MCVRNVRTRVCDVMLPGAGNGRFLETPRVVPEGTRLSGKPITPMNRVQKMAAVPLHHVVSFSNRDDIERYIRMYQVCLCAVYILHGARCSVECRGCCVCGL